MSKKRPAGEFTPSQFATCIETGLNIHAYIGESTKSSFNASKSSGVASLKEEDENKLSRSNNSETQQSAAAAATSITDANPTLPRVECTNGAMEALRLCHSAFLSMTSNALVSMESLSSDDNDYDGSTKGSKKRKHSSTSTIQPISDQDVENCLTQMGLSDLVQRAKSSLSYSNTMAVEGTEVTKSVQQTKRKKLSAQQKRKRKTNPFAAFDGTPEELLAEQERLLSESANRMKLDQNLEGEK
jgi:hypothetical protein